MALPRKLEQEQKEVDEFIKLIKSSKIKEYTKFGEIGPGGLGDRDYSEYYSMFGDPYTLAVIHDVKPVSTDYSFKFCCNSTITKEESKTVIIQEYARINGLFMLQQGFNYGGKDSYGYNKLFMYVKAPYVPKAILLACMWSPNQLEKKESEIVLNMKIKYLGYVDKGWSGNDFEDNHIFNGILLGYPKERVCGLIFLLHFYDEEERLTGTRPEDIDISEKTKSMSKRQLKDLNDSIEARYRKSERVIDEILVSHEFAKIKMFYTKYIQEIPMTSLETVGLSLDKLYA